MVRRLSSRKLSCHASVLSPLHSPHPPHAHEEEELLIAGLMETKMKFVACDMPEATPFMLHVYAAVAEQEARAISARTKAALQAAKQRGVRLGRTGAQILAPKYRAEALDHAKQLEPVISEF